MTNCVSCGTVLGAGQPSRQGTPAQLGQAAVAKKVGVLKRDVVIGGKTAFKAGEMVDIRQVSPDPARPDYKYVVDSATLGQAFRLSDNDLMA